MSAFGPALFVARKDNKPLPKTEQTAIVVLVRKHAKALHLTDDDGKRVSPRLYDHGNYEPNAVGVLIFSSYLTRMMPDDIRADHEQATCREVMKIARAIEREAPKQYRFKAYYVED